MIYFRINDDITNYSISITSYGIKSRTISRVCIENICKMPMPPTPTPKKIAEHSPQLKEVEVKFINWRASLIFTLQKYIYYIAGQKEI